MSARVLPPEERSYLVGWTSAAQGAASFPDYGDTYARAYFRSCVRLGTEETHFATLRNDAEWLAWRAGRADAALAAFGLGDTDGASVGA